MFCSKNLPWFKFQAAIATTASQVSQPWQAENPAPMPLTRPFHFLTASSTLTVFGFGGTGTGFFASESDDTEGIQLQDATDNFSPDKSNLILLEEGTQSDNSINEVHGRTPIMVRETVNTPQTEAVIGGAMKSEENSKGALYSLSENV